MDALQAKILLEKITALQKSIGLDNGDISGIERDLMLSYIRQLYEIYLHADHASVRQHTPAPTKQAASIVVPPTPEPVVQAAPVVIPEVVVPPAPVSTPIPVAAPPPLAPVPVVVEAAPTPVIQQRAAASPAIEALFHQKAARELSEKLSQQAIPDLTKALAINDKLLYANELFGRDMTSMSNTLSELNKLSSFDDAKNMMLGIAERFDWAEEERAEVASSFIKMVRRRY